MHNKHFMHVAASVWLFRVRTGVKNGFPDMIMTPFDGKFDEKKDELPPEAYRPLKTLIKNNVEKEGPPKVERNNG